MSLSGKVMGKYTSTLILVCEKNLLTLQGPSLGYRGFPKRTSDSAGPFQHIDRGVLF